MTPYRLSKIFKDSTNRCWRLCDQIGNLHHVLWKCPQISLFWENIAILISELIGHYKPLTPELALLNIGLETYHVSIRTVIAHVLFTARVSLTSKWKTLAPPTIRDIITRVNIQCQYEKLLAFKRFKASQFIKAWKV